MPAYTRLYVPGGTYFFTLVTHRRRPLFADHHLADHLRTALHEVRSECPFTVVAGVILPDHVHWIWALANGDADFSARIGRVKALFTRSLRQAGHPPASPSPIAASREKHREGDVWQRRFWEHAIRDEADLRLHLDYIHYNPVKHGLAQCPHAYRASSFATFIRRGTYPQDWQCACAGRPSTPPTLPPLNESTAAGRRQKEVGRAHPTQKIK